MRRTHDLELGWAMCHGVSCVCAYCAKLGPAGTCYLCKQGVRFIAQRRRMPGGRGPVRLPVQLCPTCPGRVKLRYRYRRDYKYAYLICPSCRGTLRLPDGWISRSDGGR